MGRYSMSEQYDVIVIGGGVAGLSTAANITEGNVLLLEKDEIKTEEKRYLRFTFMQSPERFGFSDCIVKEYDTYLFQSLTGTKLEIHFDDFEMKLLDLGKINKFLKKEVERNSDVKEKTTVENIKFDNNKVKVIISKEGTFSTLSTKYIVDASGTDFFTRKKFSINFPDVLCHCLSATFREGYIGDKDTMTFIMPTDDFKCGGWIFPFDNKDYHYGIADSLSVINSPSKTLKVLFDETIQDPVFEKMIDDGTLHQWDVGIIPIGYPDPVIYGRIAYVGNVIAQATPWIIEGIRPTSEASIMCANAINAALKYQNKSLLKDYETDWCSTYGKIYKGCDHREKWNRAICDWDKSLERMRKVIDTFGKTELLGLLRYDKMPEDRYNYLRNLKSQFCQ